MAFLKLKEIIPEHYFNPNYFKWVDFLTKLVEAFDVILWGSEDGQREGLFSYVENFSKVFNNYETPIPTVLFEYYFGAFHEFSLLSESEKEQVKQDQKSLMSYLPIIRAYKGTNMGIREFLRLFGIYGTDLFYPLEVADPIINENFKIGSFYIGYPVFKGQTTDLTGINYYKSNFYELLITKELWINSSDGSSTSETFPVIPDKDKFTSTWLSFIVNFLKNNLLPFFVQIIDFFVGDVLVKVSDRFSFNDMYSLWRAVAQRIADTFFFVDYYLLVRDAKSFYSFSDGNSLYVIIKTYVAFISSGTFGSETIMLMQEIISFLVKFTIFYVFSGGLLFTSSVLPKITTNIIGSFTLSANRDWVFLLNSRVGFSSYLVLNY